MRTDEEVKQYSKIWTQASEKVWQDVRVLHVSLQKDYPRLRIGQVASMLMQVGMQHEEEVLKALRKEAGRV